MTQVQGFMLAKRPPVVGEVENFSYTEETGQNGTAYTRIRRNGPEYGGSPYKVLQAAPTDRQPDQHGNKGYNITLAETTEATSFSQGTAAAPAAPQENTREENIAQAGAFNAAVELVASGRVPLGTDVLATIEEWHGKLIGFRRQIVGLESADPKGSPAEPFGPPTPDDDGIPF